ncbi:T9SS type A sorting domain-containing protein [Hymenobacter sp. HMF4947]|uniref:T9SS type A sorting domain-containing protein n=1 Tax=Hymenobacter ginkgonis TaxID=2682976 RepID=A0A7K1TK02_9BACT|nr:T9SS type A sorting domain-containing protein [Hymenobacter ginkgonis]MVN78734.1 T9SS type A sorting domain-containing protein [Hymenobacter ginkgonis]
MKNILPLLTAGALIFASLGAQAQITVDGTLSAAEIGTGVGKYQLAGSYTNTHSDADRGLQSMYVGYSATTLNIMLVGAIEASGTTYKSLVVYLNTPGRTGVARGTKLSGGADPQSPLKHKPTMDMEVDYGFRLSLGGTGNAATDVYFSRVSYVSGTTASGAAVPAGTDTYLGQGSKTGAVYTATLADLPGLMLAYKNSASISANTANNGLEISIPLSALSSTTTAVAAGSRIDVFGAYTDSDGIFTTDVIPQIANRTTALGADPDFTTIAGTQTVSFVLGTGVLGTRSEAATALAFSVYPNPGTAAEVVYTVPQGKQSVALNIFDNTGRRVRSLAADQAGPQSYALAGLAAGIYVVKLDVADQHTSQKVVIE